MAAPNTTGVIALIYQANPNLTRDEVKEILKSTGVDLGAQGPDNYFGYGRVDAYAAISKVLNRNELNAMIYKYDSLTQDIVASAETLGKDEKSERAYNVLVDAKERLADKIADYIVKNGVSLDELKKFTDEGIDLSEIFEKIK
jgi:subtilisin family serine protease